MFKNKLLQIIGILVMIIILFFVINAINHRVASNFSLAMIISLIFILGLLILKKYEQQQASKTNYDEITGLCNRNKFLEEIDRFIKQSSDSKLALLHLDIDHFQKVNNDIDYQAGNQVLKEISNRIKTVLHDRTNYKISRINGDEFALIIEIDNKEELEQFVQALLQQIRNIIEIKTYQFQVSASIGIAIYPFDGESSDTLLRNAEIAMYQAKKKRNSYKFFEPFIDEQLNNKLYLESELRKAIKNNDLQFYYQPQVNCYTNELMGMEALLRWNHPQHGLIPPDKFIPVAEETNLIIELGKWGIQEAFKQLDEWHKKGYKHLKISINLSLLQLKDPEFLQFVKETSKHVQIPTKYITFEITESMTMDYQTIIPVLQQLKQLGFHIAIDDFGTGYSSLSHIKRLPFDILKIDRSFVKDMCQNPVSISIIEMIISLAKKLGVEIIAEGIETREQLEILKNKGCRKIQGYYYSKPIPANQFERTVSNITRNIS